MASVERISANSNVNSESAAWAVTSGVKETQVQAVVDESTGAMDSVGTMAIFGRIDDSLPLELLGWCYLREKKILRVAPVTTMQVKISSNRGGATVSVESIEVE